MRRVAIVGVVQANPSPALDDMCPAHLAFQVTRKLLDETGMRLEDIDNVVTASCDFSDGRSISNVYTTAGTGGHLLPELDPGDPPAPPEPGGRVAVPRHTAAICTNLLASTTTRANSHKSGDRTQGFAHSHV